MHEKLEFFSFSQGDIWKQTRWQPQFSCTRLVLCLCYIQLRIISSVDIRQSTVDSIQLKSSLARSTADDVHEEFFTANHAHHSATNRIKHIFWHVVLDAWFCCVSFYFVCKSIWIRFHISILIETKSKPLNFVWFFFSIPCVWLIYKAPQFKCKWAQENVCSAM